MSDIFSFVDLVKNSLYVDGNNSMEKTLVFDVEEAFRKSINFLRRFLVSTHT